MKFTATTLLILATLALHAAEPAQHGRARSADSFVDSIGVNIHLSYFDTSYNSYSDIVKPRLLEAGIRHVRDGCPGAEQGEVIKRLNDLGQAGIHSLLICYPHDKKTPADIVAALRLVAPSLEMIEGPNETDQAAIDYKGMKFPEATRAFQDDLFATIKGDSHLKAIPVLMASISNPENAPKLGMLRSGDFANTHCYAGGTPPGFRWNWYMDRCLTNCQRPVIASESGYHNATNQSDSLWIRGVSEQASGKYLSRLLAEYFLRGISRTYIYEFMDERLKPDYSEANFGILRCTGEPKPAYAAIKNLITLLADPGTAFDPGALEYSVNGDDQPVRHLLLQKRDGRFYLLLWINAESYDLKAKEDIRFEARPTRLVFTKAIASAKVYLPLVGTNPVSVSEKTTEITVPVPDHPLIIEISP